MRRPLPPGPISRGLRKSARKFTLHPGDAVHLPTHGAHWVQNHNDVSVSLSLNMEFPKWLQADVYHANYYLRRLGFSPRPPGQSSSPTVQGSRDRRFAAREAVGQGQSMIRDAACSTFKLKQLRLSRNIFVRNR